MTKQILITSEYIWIPIKKHQKLHTLSILYNNQKVMEFQIPICQTLKGEEYSYDYYAPIAVGEYIGEELTFSGEIPECVFEKLSFNKISPKKKDIYPKIHFSPETGWINDPNGLVYHNGMYHLYFQYNPFHTEWENMSWGHAVSKDLLHWEQLETVMYPDEDGTMFSGCGLVNERGCFSLPKDALLYIYTCAGDTSPWSKGKVSVQKLAYSLDGGKTFVKRKEPILAAETKENRDPKVFWHQESLAYIMVLFLEGNSFSIYRSKDLLEWQQTQKITLNKAWECPDLFRLLDQDGNKKWVFWSADGFYYIGDFNGYTFQVEQEQMEAYQTDLPYAAQTYSNTDDRIISIPWLRTKNANKNYRGSMGLPRELSLKIQDNQYNLVQSPVKEYERSKTLLKDTFLVSTVNVQDDLKQTKVFDGELQNALEIQIEIEHNQEINCNIFEHKITYDPYLGFLEYEDRKIEVQKNCKTMSVLVDAHIYEISLDNGIMVAIFESENDTIQGGISSRTSGEQRIRIYEIN